MRSIGKQNKKKLEEMVVRECKKQVAISPGGAIGFAQAEEKVKEQIPDHWYDLWEGAYTEIENIIDDVMMNIAHGIIEVR